MIKVKSSNQIQDFLIKYLLIKSTIYITIIKNKFTIIIVTATMIIMCCLRAMLHGQFSRRFIIQMSHEIYWENFDLKLKITPC